MAFAAAAENSWNDSDLTADNVSRFGPLYTDLKSILSDASFNFTETAYPEKLSTATQKTVGTAKKALFATLDPSTFAARIDDAIACVKLAIAEKRATDNFGFSEMFYDSISGKLDHIHDMFSNQLGRHLDNGQPGLASGKDLKAWFDTTVQPQLDLQLQLMTAVGVVVSDSKACPHSLGKVDRLLGDMTGLAERYPGFAGQPSGWLMALQKYTEVKTFQQQMQLTEKACPSCWR